MDSWWVGVIMMINGLSIVSQSYEKQSFHSGTPPPFNLGGNQTTGQTSQTYGMYISAMPAPHHSMNMHQPMHQVSGRRRRSSIVLV